MIDRELLASSSVAAEPAEYKLYRFRVGQVYLPRPVIPMTKRLASKRVTG
jgi:hypothetical protein